MIFVRAIHLFLFSFVIDIVHRVSSPEVGRNDDKSVDNVANHYPPRWLGYVLSYAQKPYTSMQDTGWCRNGLEDKHGVSREAIEVELSYVGRYSLHSWCTHDYFQLLENLDVLAQGLSQCIHSLPTFSQVLSFGISSCSFREFIFLLNNMIYI